jgi:anti-sigma B factor antagonist
MSESSTYLELNNTDRAIIAAVRCEKVGGREAQVLESELKAAAPKRGWRMVLDLTDVTLLASMGLGMLVTMHKECAGQGGKLAIFGLNADIAQLLKITHLERVLKITADKDAALKLVS